MSALDAGRLKALVFDIDGTLYLQRSLQRAMLGRLLAQLAAHPVDGWRTFRVLHAYRRAQEALRLTPFTGDIASAQIALACEGANADRQFVVHCVSRWMEHEPLPLLARCVQPGALALLQACQARGLRLGALSDYPAEAKLDALGLAGLFDVVISAQAADVNVFKPHPRGLLLMLERLNATAAETLYVGDRVDVDVPTAEAAGVRCAIVAARRPPKVAGAYIHVHSHVQLHSLLWP